jgi:hypothetical protein
MDAWRKTFGFDGEDLTFSDVHMRYRARMLQTTDFERIMELGAALEAARQELGTGRPRGAASESSE